ncbi:MAG TPA: hypothetical protein VGB73_07115 [Pyrinomonadaceae bacterium]
MSEVEEIKRLLSLCTEDQRREILLHLRRSIPIHPIEAKLNTQAEVILEAIDRASDLTLRGIRGIIAEAAFAVEVAGKLEGWKDVTPLGDFPYDFLLEDAIGRVRIQVKMQRRKSGRSMMANEASKFLSPNLFVAETQRTRGGVDKATGENTRPYRFGEFDILAVSMHPSTNDWNSFMYTVADWLLPRNENPKLLMKFQPVASIPNDDWTNEFLTCVSWLRLGEKKRIRS